MSLWFVIPALLGLTVTIALWTALRLMFWSRAGQNIAGAVLLAAMACTMMGYLYQLVLGDLQLMVFWEKVSVTGLNLVYPAWLIFILFFTGNGKRVTPLLLIFLGCLSAFPIVIFYVPATSAWLAEIQGVVQIGPLQVLQQQIGWVVWVSTFIAQVEAIIGTVFLVRQFGRMRPGYHRLMMILFLAQTFGYLSIWLEVSGNNPLGPISIAILSFIPISLGVSWTIFALRVGQSLSLMREKVVETMHDSVIVLDDQNRAVYLNPAAQRTFQLSPEQAKKYPLAQLIPAWADHLKEKTIAAAQDETLTIGGMVYSIRRSAIEDWKGVTMGQVFVLRNVTDREQMEHTLQVRAAELERSNRFILSLTEVAARFEANLNQNQILEILGAELKKLGFTCVVAFIDPVTDEVVGRYTSVASGLWQTAEKFVGVTLDSFRIPFKNWQALDPDATGPASVVNDPLALISKIIPQVPKVILKQGIHMLGITPQTSAVWLPLRASDKNIGILAIWGIQEPQRYLTVFTLFARQVATAIEKARLMTDLEQLKSFNEGIVQGVAEAILMFDPQGQVTFANPAAGNLFGVPSEKLIGQEWSVFVPAERKDQVASWLARPQSRNMVGVEFALVHQDGHMLPVLINIQTIEQDGQPPSILVSLIDIQQRIRAEQQIRASVEEKEVLLKEIHHRVKNNLQIISSLLNLQAGQFKDQSMVEAFQESQNRIRTMALIHEKLYRSSNMAHIRFDDYIKELAHFLMRTFNDSARRIRLNLQVDAINLDIDAAIPCGLIINELVTNSIKHGFPPETVTGQIDIHLNLLSEHQIRLVVCDDGIGFPKAHDFQNGASLGLQLVTSLTGQLGGEVTFKTDHGAHTQILFFSENAYLSS